MAKKTFYTEHDIEDLARRGIRTLEVGEDVVLTDLARERAERLNVQLVREHDAPPSAPVRPYLAVPSRRSSEAVSPAAGSKEELFQRVRAAVIQRLGDEVDAALLDTIIRRVLNNL